MKEELKFAKTSRNQDSRGVGFDKTSEIISDIDFSMSALMSKMKHLNSKFSKKSLEDP